MNPENFGRMPSNEIKRFLIDKFVNGNVPSSKNSSERENLGIPIDLFWRLIWIGYSSSTSGWRNSVSDNVPISFWIWK